MSSPGGQITYSDPKPQEFPSLTIRGETFHHVAVLSTNQGHIFFRHAKGFADFNLEQLDEKTRDLLAGINPHGGARSFAESMAEKLTEGLPQEAHARGGAAGVAAGLNQRFAQLGMTIVGAILAAFVLAYVLFCYCGREICRKLGQEPGPLIWIPWLQWHPLFKASGMSNIWFLLTFVPVGNLIAFLVWTRRVAKACGKSFITSLFLIFPLTHLPALCYLAFSRPPDDRAPSSGTRIKL